MQICVGNFLNPTFHDTHSIELPTNTDVWFGPAMRKSRGTEKSDVLGTAALWVDVDDDSSIALGTLPPSMLVMSGGGWHSYYLLKEPCTDIDTIERLNKLLAQDVPHGDLGCWNANRIMRVPGTLNCKPEYGEPRRVRLELERPEIRYAIEDIEALEAIPDKIKHKIRTGDRRGHRTRSERDWKIVVALVKAGASDDLIRTIFNYQPCGDKAIEEPTYFNHTLERAREEYKSFKVESKSADTGPSILEGADGMYFKGRSTTRISTFTLDPVLLLDGSGFDAEDAIVCNVAAEGFTWPNITFAKSCFTSVTKMDGATKVAAWQFLGNEPVLRAILPYLMEKLQQKGLPRVLATATMGLHKVNDNWLYLGDKQTLSAIETWNGFEGPLAWLPSQREHPEMDLTWDPDKIDYYKSLMRMIPLLNIPESIWPLIGWYTMASLKPVVEQSGYRFPILNVAGTRGSGKTTLILRVFMKMFGQTDPKSYDAGTTRFVTLSLLGSSNAVPIAFSEFRVDSVVSFVRYILLSYDTGHDPRGKADQTTVDYPLSAPFSVDGEDVIDDPAAQERMIAVILHPKDIIQNSESYHTMDDFRNAFTASPGGWIIQNLIAKAPNVKALLAESFDEMMKAFPGPLPDRLRRNYTVAWTGVKLWCEMCDLIVPDINVLSSSINVVFDTKAGRSRVAVDSMVEDLANAIVGGTQAFQYVVNDTGTELWFQLASAHNYWMTSKRRQGRAVLEREAIRNQIKEASYFIGAQALNGVWMFGISLTKAFELGLDLPGHIQAGKITIRL